eukprot:305852-Chlamydomonas_euryale.AAC.2
MAQGAGWSIVLPVHHRSRPCDRQSTVLCWCTPQPANTAGVVLVWTGVPTLASTRASEALSYSSAKARDST